MTVRGRILNIIIAILMIAGAIILVLVPEVGFLIVALILCISLVVLGIRQLIFYFSMARHMVGGRKILYRGILILDVGLFALTLTRVSPVYIMVYMIVMYAINGVLQLLNAKEEKKMGSPAYKKTMLGAILNLVIAVVCIVFIGSEEIAVYIYALGLVISAIARVINAFQKNEVLYITP